MEDESNLLARCRQGDPAAWDELFDLHYEPAARFVFQLSSSFSPEDVEEICQDTFLSVIQHLSDFRGGSRFQTWVFRVAANKARDYLQKQNAAKRGGGRKDLPLHPIGENEVPAIDPPDHQPSPDAVLLQTEQASQVSEALLQLGEPCREIIELRYFGDLSYEELAASLEMNVKTVSSRLSKCLDRLEAVLKPIFSRENSATLPSNS
jgi:RNA polymerase sigma-70 factor (ECF subfamily)